MNEYLFLTFGQGVLIIELAIFVVEEGGDKGFWIRFSKLAT